MNKNVQFVVFSVFAILLFSVFVYAAGSSEGFSDTSSDDEEETSGTIDARIETTTTTAGDMQLKARSNTTINCESPLSRKERIKCRLQNKVEADSEGQNGTYRGIPEACRGLAKQGQCVALYKSTQTCYKLTGRAKDSCFKRALGLRARLAADNSSNRSEAVRNYLVLLFYDLEERIEHAHENGKLTDEESADLIASIVEIKQAILSGKSRAEVKVLIDAFKTKWRATVSGKVE